MKGTLIIITGFLFIVVLALGISLIFLLWRNSFILSDLSIIASAVVALATLVLASVSFLQFQEAREQLQKVERASLRPLVVPSSSFDHNQIRDLQRRAISFNMKNAGHGLATNIWGLIFPINREAKTVPMNQWLAVVHQPLAAAGDFTVDFTTGAAFDGFMEIAGIPLAPQDAPTPRNPLERHQRYVAQLTFTYQDVLQLKHASFFFMTDRDELVCFAVRDEIRHDLSDLNNEVGRRIASKVDSDAAS